jgi:ribonuclease-3
VGVVSRSWDGGVNAERDPAELQHALGVPIMAESLERALTHRSYAYENANPPTNERLEFLGDSVLGLVVTDTLFRGYPNLPEGQLAKLRAAVVQMGALAEVARELSLGSYVKLGRGEQVTGGRNKSSILADTLEAVIGAVYIDCGLAQASALVHRLFDPVIARSARLGAGLDWKTSLQELTAGHLLGVPEYQVEESGPDHQKSFNAVVKVGGRILGTGQGRSKKAAEQQAAEAAWNAITAEAATPPLTPRTGPPRTGPPRTGPPRTGPGTSDRTRATTTEKTTGDRPPAPRRRSRSPKPCPNCPRSRPSAAVLSTMSPAAPSPVSASCTRGPSAGSWPGPRNSSPPWPGARWTAPGAGASTCGCRSARTPCWPTWG